MTIDELVSMLADIAADFGWSICIGSTPDGDVRGFVLGELEYIFELVGDECETWAPPTEDPDGSLPN
jgi:hypothetical protein